ncbi:MAG: type II CAAX endopeptidase family protein [Nitrososphaerota archaeon]
MRGSKVIPKYHVLLIAILPLILNNILTPIVIILIVSFEEFLKKPFYSMYSYGPILWSIYHIFLFLLVWKFFKSEKESLKEIIGSLKDKTSHFISIIFLLVGLSMLIFQIIEPIASDIIYGFGMMKQMLSEYKKVPSFLFLYTVLITSMTAGICEEMIWRGYIQTRLEYKFKSKMLAITIQAILFGLWHGTSIHAIFTAIFGFISGFVYYKTRKLIPIMISHWIGDVIGFSVMYFI